MPAIKRERGTPRLTNGRSSGGGGGGGSSSSPNNSSRPVVNRNTSSSPQSNTSNKSLPAWVFMKDEKIRQYLHCDEAELSVLKHVVRIYMAEPDYAGEPLLGKRLHQFDRDRQHRKRLWEKVAAHDSAFEEMLSGTRWALGSRPADWENVMEDVKKRIVTNCQAMYENEQRREAKRKARRDRDGSGSRSGSARRRSGSGSERARSRSTSTGGSEVISLLSEDEDEEMVMSGGLG